MLRGAKETSPGNCRDQGLQGSHDPLHVWEHTDLCEGRSFERREAELYQLGSWRAQGGEPRTWPGRREKSCPSAGCLGGENASRQAVGPVRGTLIWCEGECCSSVLANQFPLQVQGPPGLGNIVLSVCDGSVSATCQLCHCRLVTCSLCASTSSSMKWVSTHLTGLFHWNETLFVKRLLTAPSA